MVFNLKYRPLLHLGPSKLLEPEPEHPVLAVAGAEKKRHKVKGVACCITGTVPKYACIPVSLSLSSP